MKIRMYWKLVTGYHYTLSTADKNSYYFSFLSHKFDSKYSGKVSAAPVLYPDLTYGRYGTGFEKKSLTITSGNDFFFFLWGDRALH